MQIDTFFYWLPIFYLIFINILAFISMWWDKWKASRQEWRVAELTLHIIGIFGGAIGIFVGIFRVRHKTQKRSFQAIAIFGLIVSIIIYWLVLNLYV